MRWTIYYGRYFNWWIPLQYPLQTTYKPGLRNVSAQFEQTLNVTTQQCVPKQTVSFANLGTSGFA